MIDERALVARIATGDQGAFAELYDSLSPLVYGVIRKVVRDPAQSEEVTQEVFVELWRTAARFDEVRGGVRAWAVTIAHRRAVDRVRSEQSHRDRQTRDADHSQALDAPAPSPEDLALASEERERARAALATLSGPQREVLELAFYGGLTHVQISDRLGVPLGTVKTRVRDGLSRLRLTMEAA